MRTSLRGHQLPENFEEFDELRRSGSLMFKTCVDCKSVFDRKQRTAAGWRETQIAGICEECFDKLFLG